MTSVLEADYLVVGAGAAGMAFTDALVDHGNASVVLVDRRHSVGGHWLDAYPFVRLHQASAFYGVASTLLGDGSLQQRGPETGLHERATAPEVCAYYGRVLQQRLVGSGKVSFHPGCEYVGDGRFFSRVSGQQYEVRARRIVDARYLSPQIPALMPAPFTAADDVRVVPVNDLVRLEHAPSQYVIVGSGKTATDACIWLLANGVDPDAICWVRPRDPWMLNRAVVQPDPAIFTGLAAHIMEAAAAANTPDDLFLRLEDFGVMLRIDRAVTPTMAKTPTLAQWELDQLRTIENVVRLGHVQHAGRSHLRLSEGEVAVAKDALIVHCAAPGLSLRPTVPIWGPDAITVQPVRAGFPCFGAALIGYVEATFGGAGNNDDTKNALCPPTPYSNTPADWPRMHVLGTAAAQAFSADPDIRAWADTVALNPTALKTGMVTPTQADPAELAATAARLRAARAPGIQRLTEFAGMS